MYAGEAASVKKRSYDESHRYRESLLWFQIFSVILHFTAYIEYSILRELKIFMRLSRFSLK